MSNYAQNQVFCSNAWFAFPNKTNFQCLGFRLLQALSCHDMFYFTSTDTECQRAKCTMSGGMAVAANDSFTRMSKAKLRTHNVNYALINRIQIIQSYAKIAAVFR
ncbi:hypothetical protein D1872_237780 [compost metagenome]